MASHLSSALHSQSHPRGLQQRRRVWLMAVLAITLSLSAVVAMLWADWVRPDSILAHETLPYYAASDLRPRWDRVSSLMSVSRFRLTDQHRRAIDEELLDNGPTVFSLFFAGCVSVCPVSMDLLRTLQASFQEQAPQFVSMTVAPLSDDPVALADYAAKFGLSKDWRLLTGAPREVEAWARNSLYSDITRLGPDGLPPHTERAFLIDARHRIRGIYDARSPYEMVRLRNDVFKLRAESAALAGTPAAASRDQVPGGPSRPAVTTVLPRVVSR